MKSALVLLVALLALGCKDELCIGSPPPHCEANTLVYCPGGWGTLDITRNRKDCSAQKRYCGSYADPTNPGADCRPSLGACTSNPEIERCIPDERGGNIGRMLQCQNGRLLDVGPHCQVSPEELKKIQSARLAPVLNGAFRQVSSQHALPPALAHLLLGLIPQKMAEPGEPYQATDVVMPDLPRRRFVVAGASLVSPDHWVLCYEHGGMGHHFHIALFEIAGDAAWAEKSGQWLLKPAEWRDGVALARVVEALRKDEQQFDNHW